MPNTFPSARPARTLFPARRARRYLAGAAAGFAVAASAACGAVTGADDEVGLDDVRGSYTLTHYNAVPIPGVIEESADEREEVLAGTLEVSADSRATMTVSERDTDKVTGQVYAYGFQYTGVVELTGGRVRLTYHEVGDPEDRQVAVGELQDGVLRLTFDADGDADEVATFRKR